MWKRCAYFFFFCIMLLGLFYPASQIRWTNQRLHQNTIQPSQNQPLAFGDFLTQKTNLNAQIRPPQTTFFQSRFLNLSNANGPILLFDQARSFGALDWYGNPAWFITLNDSNNQNAFISSSLFDDNIKNQVRLDEVGQKVVDWTYFPQRDYLYVLTDSSYLFVLLSQKGVILSAQKLSQKITRIAFVAFKNSLYGWDHTNLNPKVYDINLQTLALTHINAAAAALGGYLLNLLPLRIGLSLALVTKTNNFETNANTSVEFFLVSDDIKKFNQSAITTTTFNGVINDDFYTNVFARSGSDFVIVAGGLFSLNLNINSFEQTSLTSINQMTNQILTSAFVSVNGVVYFRIKDKKEVGFLTLNNQTNAFSYANNSLFSDQQNVRIFPVLTNQPHDFRISYNGIGYLLSDQMHANGFVNNSLLGSDNFSSDSKRVNFFLNNIANKDFLIPTIVTAQNIRGSSSSVVRVEEKDSVLVANDISGQLYVQTVLVSRSWYDISSSALLYSVVWGAFQFAAVKTLTTWVTDLVFKQIDNGFFISRDPNQITDSDLQSRAKQLISLPSVVLSSDQYYVTIVIKERNMDSITLSAIVSYTNNLGRIVSFALDDMTYRVAMVKNTYAFGFAGGNVYRQNESSSSNTTQIQDVNINVLGEEFNRFKNLIPSFINPTTQNLLPFITTHDKYPLDDRLVLTTSQVDDDNGSFVLEARFNNLEATTKAFFQIRYTNLATIASSRVNFLGNDAPSLAAFPNVSLKNITTVAGLANSNQKLATQIQPSDLSNVFSSNLTNMGFIPQINIIATGDKLANSYVDKTDLQEGSILVELDYTKARSNILNLDFPTAFFGNKFGLMQGKISQRYVGFLPVAYVYGIDEGNYSSLVNNNNVNANFTQQQLLDVLVIRGFWSEESDALFSANSNLKFNQSIQQKDQNKTNVQISTFFWEGEDLHFIVTAYSKRFPTITANKEFKISWSPRFAKQRQQNLIIAVFVFLFGVGLIGGFLSWYVLRRNRIRRFLK